MVTGSRIARRDFVSDSPIVTRSADQIKNSGNVSIESVLNSLAAVCAWPGAYTQAQGGRATLNLRGLGEQRNLILLDGRRLPPAAASGVVNINIIPQGILEQYRDNQRRRVGDLWLGCHFRGRQLQIAAETSTACSSTAEGHH